MSQSAAEISFEIGGCTDIGLVRRKNEDSFDFDASLRLLVIADGMGGHRAGEIASDLAVKSMLRGAKALTAIPEELSKARSSELCARAKNLGILIRAANTEICKKSTEDPRCAGMGTTVAAVWAGKDSFSVAHVGDSRVYLFRSDRLLRLTKDHSWARERVEAGLMAEAEAVAEGLDSVLTRALGSEPEVQVEISDHDLRQGDILILATDGLTKMIDDAAISSVASASSALAARVAQDLVKAAIAAGGKDNVTVVAACAK